MIVVFLTCSMAALKSPSGSCPSALIALMLRIKELLEYEQARSNINWQKVTQDFDAFEARSGNTPKDKTAAARQRRYRERHNGKGRDGGDGLTEPTLELVAAE
jgi:hypothetical protein